MMEGKTQKTHWNGCYRRHFDCCLSKCDEQEEIIILLKIRIAELEARMELQGRIIANLEMDLVAALVPEKG